MPYFVYMGVLCRSKLSSGNCIVATNNFVKLVCLSVDIIRRDIFCLSAGVAEAIGVFGVC